MTRSMDKGKRGEREIVILARAHGLSAERTWETAQSSDPTERQCDVRIAGRLAQVKLQGDGWRTLYAAMEGAELAFLRADRREWLCLVRAEDYFDLLNRQPEHV